MRDNEPLLNPPLSLTEQEAIEQEWNQDTLVDTQDIVSKGENLSYEWTHQPWAQYHIENDVEEPLDPPNTLIKPWDLFAQNEHLFGSKTDYDAHGATRKGSLYRLAGIGKTALAAATARVLEDKANIREKGQWYQ